MKEVQQIEAVKYALRQSKDGTVVSFVIHPEDLDPALQVLPIGARIMFGWYEITDDPVQDAEPAKAEQSVQIRRPEPPDPPTKPKRKFEDMPLAQQCAIRCEDKSFRKFLDGRLERFERVENWMRRYLCVNSRAELGKGNHDADNKWRKLEIDYQNWLTEQQYASVLR